LGGQIGRRWFFALLAAVAVTALASAVPVSAAIVQRIAWGSEGAGAGQFYLPQGIATDSSGHVYVADTGNHRIEKFSASGDFLLAWGWGVRTGSSALETCRRSCQRGLAGAGDGQLNGPSGIVTNTSGHVYVADVGNDRIQKFSSRGRFLDKWGRTGSRKGRFRGPYGVAADSAGHVYVADFFNLRIQKFSSRGRFLDKWSASYPYDVASHSDDRVYATDYYANRVEKFSSGGRFLLMWGWGVRNGENQFQRCGSPRAGCQAGTDGSGAGQFSAPQGIATDPARHVYVADSVNDRIEKFSGSGRYLTKWGSTGPGEGQFDHPHDVATDAARHVYVVDVINARIVKYAQIRPQTTITA